MALDSPGFYERTAEYVTVLLGAPWQVLGPSLTRALASVDPTAGPVVDVGAGNGYGTRVIAQALPTADILAVEPDHALRTALLALAASDADLQRRVTVDPGDLRSAHLPPRVAAVVALNVLGHFAPPDRRFLWQLVAERLAPTGVAVVDLAPPQEPTHIPATPMGEVVVGRHRYTGTARAEPAGDDAVTWEMSYQVHDGDRLVAELTARQHWHVLTPDRLADEVSEHDLAVDDPDGGIHVVRRRRS